MVVEERGKALELDVQRGLQQADIHAHALTVDTAAVEAAEDALSQMLTGHNVRDAHAHGQRRLGLVAVEPAETRQGLHQQVLPRAGTPGALGAVAGDAAVDDLRVDAPDAVIVQAQTLRHTRAVVEQHRISVAEKLLQPPPLVGILQIHGKALLAMVGGVEQGLIPVQPQVGDAQQAVEVAAFGIFNF